MEARLRNFEFRDLSRSLNPDRNRLHQPFRILTRFHYLSRSPIRHHCQNQILSPYHCQFQIERQSRFRRQNRYRETPKDRSRLSLGTALPLRYLLNREVPNRPRLRRGSFPQPESFATSD